MLDQEQRGLLPPVEPAAWVRALAEHLLVERPGAPAYIYVDHDVLSLIGSGLRLGAADCRESFLAAARRQMLGQRPFRQPLLEGRRWRAGDWVGPPPFLLALGVCVLAASERSTSHFQYYPELNRLLGEPGTAPPVGFEEDVPALFEELNRWLTGPGTVYGAPVPPLSSHAYIGFPLAHAVLRRSDRADLCTAFAAADLTPASPSPDRLRPVVLRHLRRRAPTPSRGRLLRLLEDGERQSWVEEVLRREFVAWDGVVAAPDRRLQLRVLYDDREEEWLPSVDVPVELRGRAQRLLGEEVHLERHQAFHVLADVDLFLLLTDRAAALPAPEDDLELSVQRKEVRLLQPDRSRGAWSETPSVDARAPLRVLLAPQRTALARTLRELGVPEDVQAAPLGFTLWCPSPDDWATVQELHEEPPMSPAQASWIDGLPVSRAASTYLVDGPPRLLGPPGAEVQVGGHRLLLDDEPLELPALAAGSHQVQVAGRLLPLRLLSHVLEHVEEGDVAWTTGSLAGAGRAEGRGLVKGALHEADEQMRPMPRVLATGRSHLAVGSRGQLAALQTQTPLLCEDLGLKPILLDVAKSLVNVPFAVDWLATEGRDGEFTVQRLHILRERRNDAAGDAGLARSLVPRLFSARLQDPADEPAWRRLQALWLRGGGL